MNADIWLVGYLRSDRRYIGRANQNSPRRKNQNSPRRKVAMPLPLMTTCSQAFFRRLLERIHALAFSTAILSVVKTFVDWMSGPPILPGAKSQNPIRDRRQYARAKAAKRMRRLTAMGRGGSTKPDWGTCPV
jgi:hypothetical protein